MDQAEGDDEIELDFQALDPGTLWRLDDFISGLPAKGGAAGAAGGSGNGQPVMANSDSDSESDSESE